jgi:hypothetical protein
VGSSFFTRSRRWLSLSGSGVSGSVNER